MRHLKFILSALAILLAGALAAGFAARAVAAPQTGETVNAGVVPIPSVLGQTEDEVLFYPWSLYDAQTLEPLTPLDINVEEQAVKKMSESFSWRYFAPFSLFAVDFDEFAACSAARYAYISRSSEVLMFLKDFPAQAEDGTPIVISFASSALDGAANTALSYVVRPQNPEPVTEAQQNQALEQVQADLRGFWSALKELDAAFGPEISADTASRILYEGEFSSDNRIVNLLVRYCALGRDRSLTAQPIYFFFECLNVIGESRGFSPETLLDDDALAGLDTGGVQIQLISTPDQIVVMFSCGTTMVGVYYDVQLGRYSGLGLSSK